MQADDPTTHQGHPGEAAEPGPARRRADRIVIGRPAPGQTKEEFIRSFLIALLGEDDPRVQAKLAYEGPGDAIEQSNSNEPSDEPDQEGNQR